jgi:RHS repeat-associated protein
MITRVGSDLYHDGQITSVNFTGSDHFTLDGQRLISVGSLEYRTEIETFSRIIANGSATNPTYFTVETKDGKILEYGKTDDSHLSNLVWYLNKISDKSGNYITISYTKNETQLTGECYPHVISYTGTTNTSPYNTIEFDYKSRVTPVTAYFGDKEIIVNSLISNIYVKNEGTTVGQYQFLHTNDRLTEIVRYGKNNARLNSTVVTWGAPENYLTEDQISDDSQVTNKYYGDFTGDGKADMVEIKYNTTWYLYTFDPDLSTFTMVSSGTMPANFKKAYVGDVNGDGKQDLVVMGLASSGRYTTSVLVATGLGFQTQTINDVGFWESDAPEFIVSDFNGDGKADLYVKNGTSVNGYDTYIIYYFDFSGAVVELTLLADGVLDRGVRAYSMLAEAPLHYSGNAKTDFMVVSDQQCITYEYNGVQKLTAINFSDYPTTNNLNGENLFFGDVNGDGKTDLYVYEPGSASWYIYPSMGGGTGFDNPITWDPFGFSKMRDASNNRMNRYYVRDVDGDGKSDLIMVGHGQYPSDPVKIRVAYSNGSTYTVQEYTPDVPINLCLSDDADYNNFEDFDGDGTVDLYYNDGNLSYPRMFSFCHGLHQNLVASIKNGLGYKVGFDYKPLTDGSVYDKGYLSVNYPLNIYQGPLYVVSSAWTDNVNSTRSFTNYNYQSAILHRQGKGLLGFSFVYSTNETQNRRTIDSYDYNIPYYTLFPIRHDERTINDTWVSFTTSNYYLYEYGNKRIFPYLGESFESNELTGVEKTTTYTYDNAGNGNLASVQVSNGDGSYTTKAYTDYTANGSWMPAKPQTVTLTKKHFQDSSQPVSVSTSYTYHPTTDLVLTETTNNLNKTSYDYFDNGNLKQVTRFDLVVGQHYRTTKYEYDELHSRFVTKVYNHLGHLTQYSYDDATGNVLTETAPNNQVTTYDYDNFGNRLHTNLPTGQVISEENHWATDTRPQNAVYYKYTTSTGEPSVKEYYDALGRVLRTEKTGFDGTPIYISQVFNSRGLMTKQSLPHYSNGQALAREYTYDQYGRLTVDAGPTAIKTYNYSGNSISTTTGNGLQTYTKSFDNQGNVISASDNGGTSTYTYRNIGKPGTITSNGASWSMDYDNYGRQAHLVDPDAGTTAYTYNGFNELIVQNSPKGLYSFYHDVLGRDSIRSGTEGTTIYSYDPANNPGALKLVTYPGGNESFVYDPYGRLSSKGKVIDGITYTTGYGYDSHNRLTSMTYPSGFAITNVYNTNGYLSDVKRTDNNALIWNGQDVNAFGQFTQYQYGNDLSTYKGFTNTGFLSAINTSAIDPLQDLTYNFDPVTGNLLSRLDGWRQLTETFTYDNLNRLTNISGPFPLVMSYNNNGNIASKTDAGTFSYGLPHAISNVTNAMGIISITSQHITYTPFGMTESIAEGDKSMQFAYDQNSQRTSSKLYQNGTLQKTKYYDDDYEKEISGGSTRELHYIYGGDGLAAIYEISNGTGSMYYIHKDHLGSYDAVTDQDGTVVQNYSFDAWGRRRNPEDWTYNNVPTSYLFNRGYTGHEILDMFSLINMNGRMYDPLLGRMLSPDNLVQAPDFSQSLNRYTYCLNNPLAYTDPSGNSWLSNLGNWIKDEGERLGNWMEENHVNVSVGYGTTLANPWGGTPYVGTTINGNSYNVGYNIGSGDIGAGTKSDNDAVTNFNYPSQDRKLENNAIIAVDKASATYGQEWLNGGNSYYSGVGAVTLASEVAGTTALSAAIVTTLPLAITGDTRQEPSDYSYVVYLKTNKTTGQLYIGRTSGFGTPEQVLKRRDASHEYNTLGFGPAVVHSALMNVGSAIGYPAMRGREQQVIDFFGGVGSPMIANRIRGISMSRPIMGRFYWMMSNTQFGPLAPYTGY